MNQNNPKQERKQTKIIQDKPRQQKTRKNEPKGSLKKPKKLKMS